LYPVSAVVNDKNLLFQVLFSGLKLDQTYYVVVVAATRSRQNASLLLEGDRSDPVSVYASDPCQELEVFPNISSFFYDLSPTMQTVVVALLGISVMFPITLLILW